MTHHDDLGPIPMSRLKTASGEIFAALAAGRGVLVSKRGQIVARIEPHTDVRPELLAMWATPGASPLPELSATVMNRRSPSRVVKRAIDDGVPFLVTRDSAVYGVLRRVTQQQVAAGTPTRAQSAEIDDRVNAYVRNNPSADADAVAKETAVIEREILDRPAPTPSEVSAGGSGRNAAVERIEALIREADVAPPEVAWSEILDAAAGGEVVAMLRLGSAASEWGDAETAQIWFDRAVLNDSGGDGATGGDDSAGPTWVGHRLLNPQELRIARLAADGATNRDIAAELFVPQRTVEWHLSIIFRKLGLASGKELGARSGYEHVLQE